MKEIKISQLQQNTGQIPGLPANPRRFEKSDTARNITDYEYDLWEKKIPSEAKMSFTNLRVYGKSSGFTRAWVRSNHVCNTLTTQAYIVADFPRVMNEREVKLCGSFPMDYKYPTQEKLQWMCGMSVPPVMTANIAYEIWRQWIKVIKEGGE